MADYKSRTAEKFVIRLPDGMRSRIADMALVSRRCMNSEILAARNAEQHGEQSHG